MVVIAFSAMVSNFISDSELMVATSPCRSRAVAIDQRFLGFRFKRDGIWLVAVLSLLGFVPKLDNGRLRPQPQLANQARFRSTASSRACRMKRW